MKVEIARVLLRCHRVLHIEQQTSRFVPKQALIGLFICLMIHHAYCRSTAPEQQAQAAQVRSEALQLLAPFLALPADMAQRVHAAVEAVASDVFPVFSQVGSLHTLSDTFPSACTVQSPLCLDSHRRIWAAPCLIGLFTVGYTRCNELYIEEPFLMFVLPLASAGAAKRIHTGYRVCDAAVGHDGRCGPGGFLWDPCRSVLGGMY